MNLQDVNAISNKHDGLFITDVGGNVTITASTFEGNEGSGLTVESLHGGLTTTSVKARQNDLQGIAVIGTSAPTNQVAITGGDISFNALAAGPKAVPPCGLELRSVQDVNLTKVTVDNNLGSGLCVVDAGNVSVTAPVAANSTFNWREKPTLLTDLQLFGNEGSDRIEVGVSTETLQTVHGEAPDAEPGVHDTLTLDSKGATVVDTGEELRVDGQQTVRYAGIETVVADVADESPTVEIIDVTSPSGLRRRRLERRWRVRFQ